MAGEVELLRKVKDIEAWSERQRVAEEQVQYSQNSWFFPSYVPSVMEIQPPFFSWRTNDAHRYLNSTGHTVNMHICIYVQEIPHTLSANVYMRDITFLETSTLSPRKCLSYWFTCQCVCGTVCVCVCYVYEQIDFYIHLFAQVQMASTVCRRSVESKERS